MNNEIKNLAEIHSGLKIGDKVIHKLATYTCRIEGQIVVGWSGKQDVLIQLPSGGIVKCNFKYVNKVSA